MKKSYWFILIGLAVLIVAILLMIGCGSSGGGGGGGDDHNPAIAMSSLFDVSGATAIAAASENTSSSSAIQSFTSTSVTELLKLDASGEVSSVLSSALANQWHPPISLIETGPDGSLYIGFQWGIWVTSTIESESFQACFFKISQDGVIESVDSDIYGVGSWHGGSDNGELPVKQVQFDSAGNLYYLGSNSSGNTLLKKKNISTGVISQIGSSNYEVRDFLVTDDGLVLFHGSNVGNWSIEWLRIYAGTSVSTIFYNDGAGWLRAYYYFTQGSNNSVFLIGENITTLNAAGVPQKYSGIIKVTIDSNGAPTGVTAIYDDKNMYNETHNTLGEQLTWGYWDPIDMSDKKFFTYDEYNNLTIPLSLEAGITEEAIRSFVREKFKTITTDTLDTVTFTGISTEEWMMSNYLDDLVTANIDGTTWASWREENGLNGVQFGNAKQLMLADSGKLYAVMQLDSWGSGSSAGDKLFQIVNEYGTPEIAGFTQDEVNYYKSMNKVRSYGNYAVYLSSKVGYYKVYRVDLTSPTAAPVDMTPNKSEIEIFNYSYDSSDGSLFYDVYDLSDNTSYIAKQKITETSVDSEIAVEGYTITDVTPFGATL